jgi:hypothetical protein
MKDSTKPPSFFGHAFEQVKKQVMKTRKPLDSASSPAPTGIPSVPGVRPTSMRNLTPWKGFKSGKY